MPRTADLDAGTPTRPGTVEAVHAAAESLRAAMHAAHEPGGGMAYASDVYQILGQLSLIGQRSHDLLVRLSTVLGHAEANGWLDNDPTGRTTIFDFHGTATTASIFAGRTGQLQADLNQLGGTLQATAPCPVCGEDDVLAPAEPGGKAVCYDCRPRQPQKAGGRQ